MSRAHMYRKTGFPTRKLSTGAQSFVRTQSQQEQRGGVEGGGEEVLDADPGVVEVAEAVEGEDLVVEQPAFEFLRAVSLAVSDEGGQVEQGVEGVRAVLGFGDGDAVDAVFGRGAAVLGARRLIFFRDRPIFFEDVLPG